MLAHIGAFPDKCIIKQPFHTTATWKVFSFMKTTALCYVWKKTHFDNIILTQKHAWHITQSGWNKYSVYATFEEQHHSATCSVMCNVMLCFIVQVLQDPPLCISTARKVLRAIQSSQLHTAPSQGFVHVFYTTQGICWNAHKYWDNQSSPHPYRAHWLSTKAKKLVRIPQIA